MKIDASDKLRFLAANISKLRMQCEPLWHPLGFVSCVIQQEVGQYNVRVHYWPKAERRTKNPDWPIHTHTYHLSSHIMAGAIRDIQYEQTSGIDFAVYKVSYRGGDSEIENTTLRTGVHEVINVRRTAGETYEVCRGTFHQSNVEFDESAVTLVALSEFETSAPLVLGVDSSEQRFSYDRTSFDRECFWGAVQEALSATARKF